MKYRALLLTVSGAMILASVAARAGDVKVIASPGIKADVISPDEIKKVFLKEKIALADGTHVEPVLERDGPIHRAFVQEYLGRTTDDLQTYYRVLVFTGRGSMPKELGSDAEVVAYVAGRKDAVGYVDTLTRTEGVKTLAVVEAGRSDSRKLITRIEPEYPADLKRLGIGGTVRLRVTISAKGNVEHVVLVGGNPILGDSAISAVKQWVYASGHSRTIAEVIVPFDSHP